MAAALALGAIVAPPDAVAATSIFQRLHVPPRIVTILEGESLINDASALIAYRFAVMAALGTLFTPLDAGLAFVFAAVGGVIIGLVVGLVVTEFWRRTSDPTLEIMVSLVAPFAAYLPAEIDRRKRRPRHRGRRADRRSPRAPAPSRHRPGSWAAASGTS